MPPEILALIDKPLLLAAVLAIGAVCGIAVERFVEGIETARAQAGRWLAEWRAEGGADVKGQARAQ